ncbi:hypothetical protein AMS68_002194 [Peltaster fructicola]|uniref:non-reducing end alpha-L-arabinofuranosidase n=1 Tax=Peltaster fructicola TaxID=286661 RepID=A0A6H0XPI7_9PEZI|nr:hypothetical protein AMS68_002194 [Peltaster fructicola]
MGRCIYGGLYDPDNTNATLLSSDGQGFRQDVIDTLKPLSIPMFRYPGGNFTATYHWLDGVGPRNARPRRPNLAWGGQTEDNTIGTDEFIYWCRDLMHSEPYLCLNMGTGTLDEALGWIEYCNGTGPTYYADMRRKNLGHDRPHAVKYWALGNEVWGPWQIAQTTSAASYAETALQWAKAIKLLDPSIKLIICGKEGMTSWDYEVIKHCIQPATMSDLGVSQPPLIDHISLHLYTASPSYHENVFAPLAAERAIETASNLVELACLENGVPATQERPTICFDEWNVWDARRAIGSQGAEEQYSLTDALAVAVWLNVFVRQSDKVAIACIAQSVNVISPLMTTKDGIIKQTTWAVYELFCRFMRGHKVQHVLNCDEYDGNLKFGWHKNIAGLHAKWLDVSACVDETGSCCMAVANLHREQDLETRLNGVAAGKRVEVYTVHHNDVQITNMQGEEKVRIQESSWNAVEHYVFPKHSLHSTPDGLSELSRQCVRWNIPGA